MSIWDKKVIKYSAVRVCISNKDVSENKLYSIFVNFISQ